MIFPILIQDLKFLNELVGNCSSRLDDHARQEIVFSSPGVSLERRYSAALEPLPILRVSMSNVCQVTGRRPTTGLLFLTLIAVTSVGLSRIFRKSFTYQMKKRRNFDGEC